MESLRLWLRLVRLSIRVQLVDRRSAILQILGQFLITGVEFVALAGLFARFGSFAGWSLAEAAFLYGFVDLVFAIADALSAGFDSFSQMVRMGEVDRLLLRPVSPILQLLGKELTLKRAGRLLEGLLLFGWGMAVSGAVDRPAEVLLLLLAASAGVLVFCSLFLMQAALSFVTVEALEVMNIFTYGGRTTLQRPLAGYRPLLRDLFLLVVPIGSVVYLPVAAVLGREGIPGLPSWVAWPALLAAPLFALLARGLWELGLRAYASTGS